MYCKGQILPYDISSSTNRHKLTTFGAAVNDKYRYIESIWDDYIPIHPKPPVFLGGPQLRLGDLELRKPSYVGIKDQYIVHIDMLELYDRKCAASRFCLDTESFSLVLERLRLSPGRTLPKDEFDKINVYTSGMCDQRRASFETNLANGGEDGPSDSAAWEEWDGGISAAGIMSDRSTTLRSGPSTSARSALYERQRQQPILPHPEKKEPEDLQPVLTETMILVTGGLIVGAWLSYKAFRASGK